MMHSIDTHFYPGWVRKAITFSIDDGKVPFDKKFIDITKPAGIKGTFNLCSNTLTYLTSDQYREFYTGYEIANHCKYHPYAFEDGKEYLFCEDPFVEDRADTQFIYRAEQENLYHIHNGNGWRHITDGEHYCGFIKECHQELEEIFGAGTIRSFVWPFTPQNNKVIHSYLSSCGYYGARAGRGTSEDDEFPLPADRSNWHYTANYTNLLPLAKQYENCRDDQNLKFFCIGVHSIDFERAQKWDDLKAFADQYGYRPNDYYYATVSEIFDYADAVEKLIIKDDAIENPTDIDLFILVDGKRLVLKAKSFYPFTNVIC